MHCARAERVLPPGAVAPACQVVDVGGVTNAGANTAGSCTSSSGSWGSSALRGTAVQFLLPAASTLARTAKASARVRGLGPDATSAATAPVTCGAAIDVPLLIS